MRIPRYHTVGAVVPDEATLAELSGRLEGLGLGGGSVLVLARKRDERLARAISPEGAQVRRVEAGLTGIQWLEFASTFFAASTVSFLMGVVHLWTGLVVQALLTLAAIAGLIAYHRRPRVESQLLRMGLPDKLASEWAEALPSGFALVLVTTSAEDADEAEWAFLDTRNLRAPLAADRRPVL
jgi:hypothetical protein